jgi:O-antigen biosynthesis protein WbqP
VKRLFDIVCALVGLIVLATPMAAIAIAVRATSPGPAVHWSERVGRDNGRFRMPKFRTMRIDAPQVATHLLAEPDRWVTPIGRFLRKTSLDELPQVWSILVGDMSVVGPRPALFNQHDLMALRTAAGVHKLTPGLTGWAQINGRDELSIPDKVALDAQYLERASLAFDLKIIAATVGAALTGRGVSG